MTNCTLGLDLGPNSLGWALVTENESGPQCLHAIGVRIFQEMVDKKQRTPKNQKRSGARQARRQHFRWKMRRDTLQCALARSGLLPEDPKEREDLFHRIDPYEIRKRGLDDELTPHELGRAIFHLNKRRGFRSNPKVRDSGDQKKDDGIVKKQISELRHEIEKSGSRTLGEFLADVPKKRKYRTERTMYEHEFDILWAKQAHIKPELLGAALRARIRTILFFQRPLKLQKNHVGKCTFEPRKKRSPRCRPEAQWFRALQDVNHLAVTDPETGVYRPLREEEGEALKMQLSEKKTLTWNGARKAIGLHSNEIFNLEDGGKKHLLGARTLVDIRKILTKETWEAKPKKDRDDLLEDLFSIHNEEHLLSRLENRWQLSHEQADALLNTEFEPGYSHLSLRAMRKLLPLLESGLNYHDACQDAGYLRPDQMTSNVNDSLQPAPDLRNPIVQKALNEVRKVVNAIIREHGKPTRIHVELARDLKMGPKQKSRLNAQNKKNRDLNDKARKMMGEIGESDNGENRLKYRLWKEQKGLCPYTGKSIGAHDIFSAEYEIDHILPYRRSQDDSYLNKVLCHVSANREKGNDTPKEKWGNDEERFTQLRQRILSMKDMAYSKRRRFDQENINLDDFIARQLNDTRYISREVSKYLKELGAEIQVTTGQATAALRRSWGLNAILAVDSELEKNRADHRHHAIDALVVALTSKKLFYSIARLSEEARSVLGNRRFPLREPWPGFMEEVREKVANIVVSHQPLRKISGAFHKETAYGRILHAGRDVFARKVFLEALTKDQAQKIVDPRIRELVTERLKKHAGNVKAAFAKPLYLQHSRKGSGRTPIKSVRLAEHLDPHGMFGVKRDGEDAPFTYYVLGNNHHIEILENVETGTRKGIVVTTMEAANRVRREHSPIVRRHHGDGWRFVTSLAINDLFQLDTPGNDCSLYRVQQITGKGMTLRKSTSATLDDNTTRLIKTPNTLRGQKMSVDYLGNLEATHD